MEAQVGAEARDVWFPNITIHISHQYYLVANRLPFCYSQAKVLEKGIAGRASIALAEQVRLLLGSYTAGLGQGGITGPVGTDNMGGSAGSAREGKPNPAT